MKFLIGSYIREKVIENLLDAHKRIAEQSNDVDKIIKFSKYLFKISERFNYKILDFGLKECEYETYHLPKSSKREKTI